MVVVVVLVKGVVVDGALVLFLMGGVPVRGVDPPLDGVPVAWE